MIKKRGLVAILALTMLVSNPFKSYARFGNLSYSEKSFQIPKKFDLGLYQKNGKIYSNFYPIKKISSFRELFKTDDFSKDPDEVLFARILLGEGEGMSRLEKIKNGYVALNRLADPKKKYGKTIKEVLLKPKQFSSLKEREKILKDPLKYSPKEFLECLTLSKKLLNGDYKDPTEGATHFFNPYLIKTPYWANHMDEIKEISKGLHKYYKER
jgi:spore germination cell wall hydrolase CwlJ-like protein